MDNWEAKAWELKHQLIVESIRGTHDFDLDKINEEVRRRLGPKPDIKAIWREIDDDWDNRHGKSVVSAVKQVLGKA